MSPILSFSGERRPPPFRDTSATSYRRPSTDHGACDDLDAEDESDASPPSYPPPGPSSSPPPLAKHTKLKRSRTGSGDERYGQREEEDAREEEEGLLYELDRLDASGVTLPESAAERTARGARALGVGTGVGFCGIERPTQAAWREIRELMLEVRPCSPSSPRLWSEEPCSRRSLLTDTSLPLQTMPTLLLTLLGLVFTGELLEHLSHWRVFERVDELFILTPMLANLKGNLEMCLGARLSTSVSPGSLWSLFCSKADRSSCLPRAPSLRPTSASSTSARLEKISSWASYRSCSCRRSSYPSSPPSSPSSSASPRHIESPMTPSTQP